MVVENSIRSSVENSTALVSIKWYDNKFKLALSTLIWPLLIYGIYKTNLIKKKTKQIIGGVLIVLVVIGFINDPTFSTVSVRQSPWDNSVDCVEYYLKHNYLRDPDSYEGISWSKVEKNNDDTYQVTHTFRARNGFGGMGEETLTFTIASDGWTIINVY